MPVARPDVEHVLAERGRGGYRQYRIPALAVTPRGTLLAAYDGRPNLDDLPSPIDLLLRRSLDSGQSWQDQQVVRTGVGLEGYGDPSLLVDAETGRVFMFHAAGTRAGFFEAAAGVGNDDGIQHCDVSYSDDDGLTWQHRRLTAQLKLRSRPSPRDRRNYRDLRRSGAGHPDPCRAVRRQARPAVRGPGRREHPGGFRLQRRPRRKPGRWGSSSARRMATVVAGAQAWRAGAEREQGCVPQRRQAAAAQPRHPAPALRGLRRRRPQLEPADPRCGPPGPERQRLATRFDGLPLPAGHATAETDAWLLASNNHDSALRRNTVLSLSRDNGASWPVKLVICAGSSRIHRGAPPGRQHRCAL